MIATQIPTDWNRLSISLKVRKGSKKDGALLSNIASGASSSLEKYDFLTLTAGKVLNNLSEILSNKSHFIEHCDIIIPPKKFRKPQLDQ